MYTFVTSKGTKIDMYKVTQADRQTHSNDNNCSVLCYACGTQQNETHLSMLSGNNRYIITVKEKYIYIRMSALYTLNTDTHPWL